MRFPGRLKRNGYTDIQVNRRIFKLHSGPACGVPRGAQRSDSRRVERVTW